MEGRPLELPDGLIAAIRRASRIAVLTGAGVSAESGIPTFRDALQGLWANFRPEELATPEAFRSNPRRVWEWYAWRREQVAQVAPNAGHLALAALQARVPGLTLITQNVDGLHQRAGSREVIELHGNIGRVKCFDENRVVESWTSDAQTVPPRCPRCGGMLRPDVVWFGEALPQDALETAMAAARTCELFLSIGTSSLVHPAASLAYEALQCGAVTVEVNPDKTPLSDQVDYVLRGPAGRVLPRLLQAARLDAG